MATYQEKRATLIGYLKMKVDEADWHGVSDAANDLRVLEAEHAVHRYAPTLREANLQDALDTLDRTPGHVNVVLKD